jgi:hypothetical protein
MNASLRDSTANITSDHFPLVTELALSSRRCSSVRIPQQSRFLEQVEQFKDDHDNDNYSDYIEDASVHVGG